MISVIIPAYNASEYIKKCLKSLINQTFKDLEIIVINDGSTDNTLEILEDYAQKDRRIKIVSQTNSGLSKTRNNGIELAKGEYISFMDADDWVNEIYYEKLYNSITAKSADIACSTIVRYRKNAQKFRVKYTEEKVYTTLSDKIKACSVPKCCYVWNKLYKTELVKNLKFREGMDYEDVMWTPEILKASDKLVTVPECVYYYRVNKNSIVKQKQSAKKQEDSYFAKKYIIDFFTKNNLELAEKNYSITKSIKYFLNFPILRVKECHQNEIGLLFNFLPIYKKQIKTPVIKENTFIVWEPCSKNHAEVVPGFAKYLLELGYHVSVIVSPQNYKDGLFSRFKDENLTLNKLSRKDVKKYFRENNLDNVAGVLVTTGGKLCDKICIEDCYKTFSPHVDKSKLFFVFHDAKLAVDEGTWREDLITLRKLDYNGAKSTVVNPHYFGVVKSTPKNSEITNFVTVGAIQGKKKNNELIINSVKALHEKGYRNFKVTVIGKGSLKHLPKELQPYFNIKGRLPFDKMFDELEKADFLLTSYDETNPNHIFYNTTGTSGNFQLVYGFNKPCIIIESFGPVNGFDNSNSILYKADKNYPEALIKGIEMTGEEYSKLQENLQKYTNKFYQESKENLKNLINKERD